LKKKLISGFYKLGVKERVKILNEMGIISCEERYTLERQNQILSLNEADKMVENVIGVFGLPLAIASDFLVNDKNYFVPMVVEEPSVVAGVNNAAKIIKSSGGFKSELRNSLLVGQIQIRNLKDTAQAKKILQQNKSNLIEKANELIPRLNKRGGGVKDIDIREVNIQNRLDLVLHLHVNTADAMGANLVNTVCEGLSDAIEGMITGNVGLKILSNYTDQSLVKVEIEIHPDLLEKNEFTGIEVRDGIIDACDFANADPYRAVTHNKGIMNGIDAVAIATGNDWRAIEAAAHAYASSTGRYKSLSNWDICDNGNLKGELLMPIKVGIVGGSLSANPASRMGLNITKVDSATELSELIGAVGLAQNFAALRALATNGIQQAHMKLHARSVALSAGIPEEYFSEVIKDMINSKEIKKWKAQELLEKKLSERNKIKLQDKKKIVGSASAKFILLGEHAVVYDRYAIAYPINDAVKISINDQEKNLAFTLSGFLEQEISEGSEYFSYFKKLLDVICNSFAVDVPLVRFDINSQVPLAMGLGASASIAVALSNVLNNYFGLSKNSEEINKIAFECEKINHIQPSGIDNTVASFGKAVFYNKNKPINVLSKKYSKSLPIIIAMSKSPSKTSDLVTSVADARNKNKELFEKIFDQMGEISQQGLDAIKKENFNQLGDLMNIYQGLLNSIGVSTPELESMIDIARSSGALGAKLTGSGGGGSIIALCPDHQIEVRNCLNRAGYQTIVTNKDND